MIPPAIDDGLFFGSCFGVRVSIGDEESFGNTDGEPMEKCMAVCVIKFVAFCVLIDGPIISGRYIEDKIINIEIIR